jgi:pimeloyl-ACP methyl ester carboxylesterase
VTAVPRGRARRPGASATGRRLHVAGTELFVRELGEGSPVVLFNGIGAHVDMWRPMERALDGVRIVSFDAPGTGRSQTRLLPSTMSGLARLVERLFDRLELERADVLGYSFGGALAQEFAARHPERLRRLVLAATVPGWGGVPGRLGAMLAMGTPLRYYSRPVFERTAPTMAGGRARHDRDHVRRMWLDRAGHVPSPAGYAQQLWAMTMWSGLASLGRIQAPTLVVTGDDDPLVPLSNALMMAARIPRARLFVARGEGHFQLLDEHRATLPAIRQFLLAETLADAPVWRSAARVQPEQVAAQLRSDGLGALPWGAVSAVLRRVVG